MGIAGFSARLRICRVAAGLSQQELADRSGLSIRAVSNMERGRTQWPYRASLTRLADALGLGESARAEFLAAVPRRRLAPPLLGEDHSLADEGPGIATADRSRVVPQQLPPWARHFTGRAAELAALDQLLVHADQGGPGTAVISAISGMAGVGKTALALRWAHRVASRFPDGQLYANLRGYDPVAEPVEPQQVVRGFLDALGVVKERIPARLDDQAGLYRSLLAGKQMLIVLDNARNAAQVRPLLPGSPGCLVLATSRGQLTSLAATDGATMVVLDPMTEAEAREMMAAHLGAQRVAADPAAVAELVRLCGGLPLALAISAARISAHPEFRLGVFAEELKDAKHRLDALETADGSASVRAVFSWSLGSVPASAAQMFALLGLHPGPDISIAAAASLAGIRAHRAHRALGELAEAHLVTQHVPGRFSLHDLLRAYATEQAAAHDGDTARTAAAIRPRCAHDPADKEHGMRSFRDSRIG